MLYSLPSGAMLDVVPFSTANNVHGVIKDSFGTYAVNATELAAPLDYTRVLLQRAVSGASYAQLVCAELRNGLHPLHQARLG